MLTQMSKQASGESPSQDEGRSWVYSSGALLLLAVACALVFLGANFHWFDENAEPFDRQQLWSIIAAAIGGTSLLGALYMAWKNR